MTASTGSGPTPEEISLWIRTTYHDTVVAEAMGATFFSLDPSHWPNFATIVTTDEHDTGAPSNLTARPGVFRLNIGLGPTTMRATVGSMLEADARGYVPRPDVDYAALDTLVPHPVYAAQRWISILNPSRETFEDIVKPLIAEAHDLLAGRR
jgi:hypothetical protein